jgi:hypothetical protein
MFDDLLSQLFRRLNHHTIFYIINKKGKRSAFEHISQWSFIVQFPYFAVSKLRVAQVVVSLELDTTASRLGFRNTPLSTTISIRMT